MLIQLTTLTGEKINLDLNKVNSILTSENGKSQIGYLTDGEQTLSRYLVSESLEEIFLIVKREIS